MLGTSTIERGILYPATWVRQCSDNDSVATSSNPGRTCTTAATFSPNRASGRARYQGVENCRVSFECLLHFFGVDLLAAGVDAHRTAPEQHDGSVGFHRAHVPEYRQTHPVDDGKSCSSLGRVAEVGNGNMAGPGDETDCVRAWFDATEFVVDARIMLGLDRIRLEPSSPNSTTPSLPDSEAPNASLITNPGSRVVSSAFRFGENNAPPDPISWRVERS